MSRSRQTVLLIALAAVTSLAALQWAGWLGLGPSETVTVPISPARPAFRTGPRPSGRIASLNTAALAAVPAGGLGGRDPWRFIDPPPVQKASQRSETPQAEVRLPEAAQPPEPSLPHPADFNLRYLGRFGPPEKQIAVFTNGSQIFNRQEGELLDGKFIVSRIGYESVEIRFVGFPEVPARRVGVAGR